MKKKERRIKKIARRTAFSRETLRQAISPHVRKLARLGLVQAEARKRKLRTTCDRKAASYRQDPDAQGWTEVWAIFVAKWASHAAQFYDIRS